MFVTQSYTGLHEKYCRKRFKFFIDERIRAIHLKLCIISTVKSISCTAVTSSDISLKRKFVNQAFFQIYFLNKSFNNLGCHISCLPLQFTIRQNVVRRRWCSAELIEHMIQIVGQTGQQLQQTKAMQYPLKFHHSASQSITNNTIKAYQSTRKSN